MARGQTKAWWPTVVWVVAFVFTLGAVLGQLWFGFFTLGFIVTILGYCFDFWREGRF